LENSLPLEDLYRRNEKAQAQDKRLIEIPHVSMSLQAIVFRGYAIKPFPLG
jgi:hypothetical protein